MYTRATIKKACGALLLCVALFAYPVQSLAVTEAETPPLPKPPVPGTPNPLAVPASDVAQNQITLQQSLNDFAFESARVAKDVAEKTLKQLAATLFKNVVGTLANTLAKQSAQWVVSSGKGGSPQFITDFSGFIKGYADAVIGDVVSSIVRDVTGIDLCTFDPRLTLDLSLAIPFFPTSEGGLTGPQADCSWSKLTNHWEEIGNSKLLSVNLDLTAGTFPETTQALGNQIKFDDSLRTFPGTSWAETYVTSVLGAPRPLERIGAPDQFGLGLILAPQPPMQKTIGAFAAEADLIRAKLAERVEELRTQQNKGTEITKELLQEEQKKLIDTYVAVNLKNIRTTLLEPLKACKGASWQKFSTDPACNKVAKDLNMQPNEAVTPATATDTVLGVTGEVHPQEEFAKLLNDKVSLALTYAQSTETIFKSLEQTIIDTLREDFFNTGEPYDPLKAKSVFAPSANQFNVQREIATQIINEGMSAYLSRSLQAQVDQGWKSVTEKISDIVQTPSTLIREYTATNFTKNDVAEQFTGEILADAAGVFTKELWNGFMAKLLLSLSNSKSTSTYDFKAATENCEQIIQQDPNNIPDYCQAVYEAQGASLAGALARAQAEIAAGQLEASQLARRILQLANGDLASRIDTSLYDQEIPSADAIARRVNSISQAYTSATSVVSDLDLFSEMSLQLTGTINPNLYNNVIDSNLAQAISKRYSIAQALQEGKLVGTNRFSFGEKAEPGTYHLANIKKLRKARVVPLGLELAAQLVRDCAERAATGTFADFSDVTATEPAGGVTTDTRLNLVLQNCVFRPVGGEFTEQAARDYNKVQLQKVLAATVADVVNGYSQAGSGICGDFDANESPFCNLVNPQWVLKLPPSQCFEIAKDVPEYGELLQNNASGTRYTRCVNIASCLYDDGTGNCTSGEYGYCAKEKNIWRFTAQTCRPEFAGCTSYQQAGRAGVVSYIKNTLGGNAICGPQNAGCAWYSTTMSTGAWQDFGTYTAEATCLAAGGTWLTDHCESTRAYFNRYASSCPADQEGCTEVVRFHGAGNNLVADSDFEYTDPGAFPAGWDLRKKSTVASRAACTGADYYETCTGYPFDDAGSCTANGGTWSGTACTGAVNSQVGESACQTAGGTYGRYCLASQLRHNLCDNPQFLGYADQAARCTAAGGAVGGSCSLPGITDAATCTGAGGTWTPSCTGAKVYDSASVSCTAIGGAWKGYGPFAPNAAVERAGSAQNGLASLRVSLANTTAADEYQLVHTVSFGAASPITQQGDGLAAAAYLRSNVSGQATLAVVKTNQGAQIEMNALPVQTSSTWTRTNAGLLTGTAGTELRLVVTLKGGQTATDFYIDGASLGFNSVSQVQRGDLVAPFTSYDQNQKEYFRLPPDSLSCRGYDGQHPSPTYPFNTQASCEGAGGYWDQPAGTASPVYGGGVRCYRYPPDVAACSNFAPICSLDEVGCQLYTPASGDPAVPGVVSSGDYCPAACVGYSTYRVQAHAFDPAPAPAFVNFIPSTGAQCTATEVGCSAFTSLEGAAAGGEQVSYFSYIRQCIKPGLGLGEKQYFTYRGSATGTQKLVTFTFKAAASGAPDTIDGSADCRVTLGEDDFNCIKFQDTDNNIYYRDIRKTISVSDDCRTYRREATTETSCIATKGVWTASNTCEYSMIPAEGVSCRAAAVGCTEYRGNRGNNVLNVVFDTFEGVGIGGWASGETGTNAGNISRSAESVTVGGSSLSIPAGTSAVHKSVRIEAGASYTVSFWARTDAATADAVSVRFSSGGAFAAESSGTANIRSEWGSYTLGPVFIADGADVFDNQLIIGGIDNALFLDNILVKRVNDSIYLVKNSWNTPAACDQDITGAPSAGAMLGCQAYTASSGESLSLKSFASLCREQAVGCSAIIRTQNSRSPYAQSFNTDNQTHIDDVTVPADAYGAAVLADRYACSSSVAGCTKLGKAIYDGVTLRSYQTTFVLNQPDRYQGVAEAIMCSDEALGCQELIGEGGGSEYYKVDETKLCTYSADRGGWVKKGAPDLGCATIDAATAPACAAQGGVWVASAGRCGYRLKGAFNEQFCTQQRGTWVSGVCVADPYTLLPVDHEDYAGFVGECSTQFNGCTEFVDRNPNYLFNGDMEDLQQDTGMLSIWAPSNSAAGRQLQNTDTVKYGARSIELRKTSPRVAGSDPLSAAGRYAISQKVSRLEAGKTYELSFWYFAGDAQRGQGEGCTVPEAAYEFNYYEGTTNRTNNPIVYYGGTGSWKQVSVLYQVPQGAGYPLLQDHILRLFAPSNGNCAQSSVIYDRIEVKPHTEDRYVVIDTGENIDRTSCAKVDWENGCIEFRNTKTGREEILKVQRDRVCGEWLECSSKYTASDNYCMDQTGNLIPGVTDRASCEKGGVWTAADSYCRANTASESDCTSRFGVFGGSWSGGECRLTSVRTQIDCLTPRGSWTGSACSGAPVFGDIASCIQSKGNWVSPIGTCTGNSGVTRAECEKPKNRWMVLEGSCKAVDLCVERSNGVCVRWSTGTAAANNEQDDVRYDAAGDPLVVRRIAQFGDSVRQAAGYIYRFGTVSLDRLTQWRAGDYSGYTIPDRYPIESSAAFQRYPTDTASQRYETLTCRIFPESTSPVPRELKNSAKYSGAPYVYSTPLTLATEPGRDQLGNLCAYTAAQVQGITIYQKIGTLNNVSRVCVQPAEKLGFICTSDADCSGVNGSCKEVTDVQDFYGNEGLCLESDTLNPIYGTMYQDAGLMTRQPYACLTHYPFEVNWAALNQSVETPANYRGEQAP